MKPAACQLCLVVLTLLWAVGSADAQAVAGPKLELFLPGETTPVPRGNQVIAWGDNSAGQTAMPADARSDIVAIAAGADHTVALKQDGRVIAWGGNYYGQTTVPAAAQSGVKAIAAGGYFTVVLKQDGSVLAWGSDFAGQTTVPAAAQNGVVAIAAGGYHTVALKQDGRVIAWGYDFDRQTTVATAAQSDVVAISGGWRHTVALKQDGRVIAWGDDYYGQTSVPAAARSGVTAIAAGSFQTVALKQDGGVVAWGEKRWAGQSYVRASAPAAAQSGVVAIAAGGQHMVALKQDGSVIAWGINDYGQTTVPAAAESGVVAIAAGGSHTVAINPVPLALDWGKIDFSRQRSLRLKSAGVAPLNGLIASLSGRDASHFTLSPTTVPSTIAAGVEMELRITFDPRGKTGPREAFLTIASNDPDQPTYVVRLFASTSLLGVRDAFGSVPPPLAGNRVIAWGNYLYRQTSVPTAVQSDVVTIAAGGYHTAALKRDGGVVAWGNSYFGQATVPVAAQSNVVAIAAGEYHTVALKQDGGVIAWGDNSSGQTTVPTAAQSGVIAIAAGQNHSVVLKLDGSVIAWGDNGFGQTTLPMAAQKGVVAIAAGGAHTVALKEDGSVIAWGDNGSGQTTVPAVAKSGVVAISAGAAHTVALKQDGSVIAWGRASEGQTTVPAAAQHGVVAVAAGGWRTVAIKQDGSAVGWGWDDWGWNISGWPNWGGTLLPTAMRSGVTAIAAGAYHTVAIKNPGVGFTSCLLGQSKDEPLTIESNGDLPLAQLCAEITGADADVFTITSTVPSTLAVNSTSPLNLRFAPTRLGPLTAMLRIHSNDPATPVFDLPLTGTGTFELTATKPNQNSALTYAPPAVDRATGLILQKLTFVNPTSLPLNGLRLRVAGVTPGISLYSSSATETPGTLEVLYSKPIAAGETATMTLTYFDPKRRTNLQPTITAEALLDPEPRSQPVTGALVPLLSLRDTPNGPYLEWRTLPGKVYVVEYSDDAGKTWFSAVHRLKTGGTRMFWIDHGQPETYFKPANKAARMYRVKML